MESGAPVRIDSRRWSGPNRILLLLVAVGVLLPALPADARRGTRDAAIDLCTREMSRRFGNAAVRIERKPRVTRRGDRLSVEAQMRARRFGGDVTRDVDCAVDFSGRQARVVAFSSSRDATTGSGWGRPGGGDDERAARMCWREAQSVGYPVRAVLGIRPRDRGARLVVLRAGVNNEVHCLYRNGVRDMRYHRR